MDVQEQFIPFYCNNCNELAFIYRQRTDDQPVVIEYHKNKWRYHLCFNLKGKAIWGHQPSLPEMEWEVPEIPVAYSSKAIKSRQTSFSLGVITELPANKESIQQNAFIKVLTVENSVIYIRAVERPSSISAGLLIDLSQAKKVGPDKFRVPEIVPVSAAVELENQKANLNDYFSFALSAHDQEQLESFVDRFLQMLSKNNLYLNSIVPVENTEEKDQLRYKRTLTISSAYKLQKAVEMVAFPDSIQISLS